MNEMWTNWENAWYPAVSDVFEKFVKIEEELRDLLKKRIARDKKMLIEMGKAG